MKDKAKEIKEKVMDKVQNATKQFHGVEDDVQKLVKGLQDKLLATPADGLKKFDELLKTLSVNDFVEKVKAIDLSKQAQFHKDLMEKFGGVAKDQIEHIKGQLDELNQRMKKLEAAPLATKTQLQNLSKKLDNLTKKVTGEKAEKAE